MAVLNNLYPPTIDTYMPAFLVGDIITYVASKTYKTLSYADVINYEKEVDKNIINSGVSGVEELWNTYQEELAILKETYKDNYAEYVAHANALKLEYQLELEALLLNNPREEEIENTFFEEKPEVVEITRTVDVTTANTTDEKYICRIYFALSYYNKMYEIANAQVTVRSQSTNRSVLHKTKYPCEIALKQIKKDNNRQTNDKYYIEIKPEDLEGCNFEIDKYYKVQIRFTGKDATDPGIDLTDPDAIQAIDSWLTYNEKYFSEWSTVCLIRGISEPTVELKGFSTTSTAEITENIANTQVVGQLLFADENETETLKSYQIKVYNSNNELLFDTNMLYSNDYTDVNTFNYAIKYYFPVGEGYYFTLNYITKNLYEETLKYNFNIVESQYTALSVVMDAYKDVDNGNIGIRVTKSRATGYFTGSVVIRRADHRDGFSIWEDVYSADYYAVNYIDFIWHDYTIESGVWYKYAVQAVDPNGVRKPMLQFKVPIMMVLEDMFLSTADEQIRIAFNPNISSFKQVYNEVKIDTIGSQYPYIKRSGYNNYAQFPIGGMIFSQMDEDGIFLTKEDAYGDMIVEYENYNDVEQISPYSDVIWEKTFRDKVKKFLEADDVKLFRSPTEGNYLVKLMDIQFQPNQTLGRRLWSFSATAYEIDACNIDNYNKYNIMSNKIESAEGVSIGGE